MAIDTNVLVSSLFFQRGTLAWLRIAWRARQILPLVSPMTARELLRVLAYPKFDLNADDQREFLDEFLLC